MIMNKSEQNPKNQMKVGTLYSSKKTRSILIYKQAKIYLIKYQNANIFFWKGRVANRVFSWSSKGLSGISTKNVTAQTLPFRLHSDSSSIPRRVGMCSIASIAQVIRSQFQRIGHGGKVEHTTYVMSRRPSHVASHIYTHSIVCINKQIKRRKGELNRMFIIGFFLIFCSLFLFADSIVCAYSIGHGNLIIAAANSFIAWRCRE